MFRNHRIHIVAIGAMITVGIGFAIIGFFLSDNSFQSSSRETEEPKSAVVHAPSPRIHSIPELSQPVLQVEPVKKNETLTTSENEETNKKLSEEDTPKELLNLSSADIPSDEERETTEETERESYPVGDLRRLTPQERIRHQQIIKELEDLDREGQAFKRNLTMEDWITKYGEIHKVEQKLLKRQLELIVEWDYYLQKLGFPSRVNDTLLSTLDRLKRELE